MIDEHAIRRAIDLPGSWLTADYIERMLRSGAWQDRSLVEYLDDAVAADPDAEAAVTISPDGEVVRRLSYAALDALSRRVSAGLLAAGIGPGAVVSVMMSNCAEFTAVVFGILRIGATYSGIPITYGAHEIEFMTRRARSRMLIVTGRHGDRDLAALAVRTLADRPEVTIVVHGGRGAEGAVSFADLIEVEPFPGPAHADPLRIAQLAFTSGTTDEPKAVMNLHATLDHMIRAWVDHVGPRSYGEPARNLVMSPVGHSTGFMWGALLSALLGGTAVYVERWSPEIGARVLSEQRITCLVGSPTFAIDLIRTAHITPGSVPNLRLLVVAGAPIPRPLMTEARAALDCTVVPAWGMTEHGIAVSGRGDLGEINDVSDGQRVGSAQLRVCDAEGRPLDDGVEGDLQLRGPGLFAGYYGRPDFTAAAFGDDSWFNTGDRAIIGSRPCVTITGRSKDIIIRGGENVPVAAVESLIFRHPLVRDVAVVGYPDERLGERALAVVTLVEDAHLDLAELSAFLLDAGLSKRYLPERLAVVTDMPKTMSGKIRKVELRERVAKGELDA